MRQEEILFNSVNLTNFYECVLGSSIKSEEEDNFVRAISKHFDAELTGCNHPENRQYFIGSIIRSQVAAQISRNRFDNHRFTEESAKWADGSGTGYISSKMNDPVKTGFNYIFAAQNEKDYDDDLYLQRTDACIGGLVEDLMVQARKIRYDVIGLTETRRQRPLNATFHTGEELFLGTCDSREVGGAGALVNTNLAMNIDSFEQLTTRVGRLRLRRCGSMPALTVFIAYAPTFSYDEDEIEAFYMDLKRFYREDHTFYKVIVGDFNAKIGPRRTPEEFHIGTHGLERNE
ncbi:hypothetical protein Y032_0255g338 [Ancylostoma ceylanicum]|uniref:Endonuclease/exonuclease/phosphatase domain-containing protein n=1 Tax=Ancylostoma ceylanicum TaxID=53326 RepID=A0A016SCB7_9BILA|nr:hypothetical protein Y032_0255g338 [Ancylostoma ceylanicum]